MKNKKKLIFFGFAIIILLVPLYIIFSSQDILSNGTLYKFKPEAYDPFDPFRGKFLRINYDTGNIATDESFEEGDVAYVSIGVDEDGYAFFEKVHKNPPKDQDYLSTKISYVSDLDRALRSLEDLDRGFEPDVGKTVSIEIPDNMQKYFINEDYAVKAEEEFRKRRDDIYVGIRIKNGASRLEDIYVDGKPFKEYLRNK